MNNRNGSRQNMMALCANMHQRLEKQERQIQSLQQHQAKSRNPKLHSSNQGIIQPSELVISRQEYLYQRFHSMGPKGFEGSTDPLDGIEWLNSIHSIFDCLKFNDEDRIRYVVCLLRKDATYWWKTTKQGNELHCSTWFGFKIEFHQRYCNEGTGKENFHIHTRREVNY